MSSDKGVEHYLSLYGIEYTSVPLPVINDDRNCCDDIFDRVIVLLEERGVRSQGQQTNSGSAVHIPNGTCYFSNEPLRHDSFIVQV